MSYVKCSRTGRLFHINNFPKKCNCCNRVFTDRKDYLDGTIPLENGQFGCAKNEKVLEFRNCSCGSTLVMPFQDERDYTPAGSAKRTWIGNKIKSFIKNGHTYREAKLKAISEFETSN